MLSFKSGFNSKRFSLWLQSPKKVQNHSPEHYSPTLKFLLYVLVLMPVWQYIDVLLNWP